MEGGKSVKDKAMAARMKGSFGSKEVRIGGVTFTCKVDAEYRTEMKCPMCHGVIGINTLDNHLRGHMGSADSQKQAA